ncbi:MAG: hypothetical protein K2H89_10550, partial [Oscillospiraceae bacterium]|nr:hypothetical protein [Oscillospiraceae bacterium]
ALRHFQKIGLQAKVLRIENAKDPDEFLKKYGREKFRQLLEQAQDATSFQINRCRNDLDLQTEQGKTSLLRRAVPVLAEIQNDSERKNQILRIAGELEIDPGILEKQVKSKIKKQTIISRKTAFQEIEKNFYKKDNMNPLAKQYQLESKSEEIILAYCMLFPEQTGTVFERLSPEHFVTDFHKKIYQNIRQCISENLKFIPSFLGSCFEIREISYIARILTRYRDMLFTPEVIRDCIANLQNAETKDINFLTMSDSDLQQIIVNKQKRIRWTN